MTFWNYKNLITSAILSSLISTTHGVTGLSVIAPLDGLQLAQAVYNQATGNDTSSKMVMRLAGKGKKPKQRILYSYSKKNGGTERWTLLRFMEPKKVAKTSLLTKDYSGDKSDQWLYLPALGQIRRISSSRKGGRFVGSDFQYEDLMNREADMDHHSIIGKDTFSGTECTLLESIPIKKSNSIYSKRVSCIHLKILIPLRIDYYEKGKEQPVKRLAAKKIKKIQGFWTVFDSTMSNLKTGHSTKLTTTKIKYDQGIPDTLFGQRGLSDDSREIPFRP